MKLIYHFLYECDYEIEITHGELVDWIAANIVSSMANPYITFTPKQHELIFESIKNWLRDNVDETLLENMVEGCDDILEDYSCYLPDEVQKQWRADCGYDSDDKGD